MKFFRSHFSATPQDFEAILEEIASKSQAEQDRLRDICVDFYMRNSALENTSNGGARMEQRAAAMTTRLAVKGIQQIGLASPLYGIWKCPDLKDAVPHRLPLSAFDAQGPNEKLRYVKATL
jgi:hypothetical protein